VRLGIEEDISTLQISVDDVSLMEVLEGVVDLVSDIVNHLRVELSLSNILEVAASHNFLNYTEVNLVLKNVKNAHNIRMVCVVKDEHFGPQS
jgi:GMP synthase PP-ATPase subunit